MTDAPHKRGHYSAKPRIWWGGFCWWCDCICCNRRGWGNSVETAYRDWINSHMLPDVRMEEA